MTAPTRDNAGRAPGEVGKPQHSTTDDSTLAFTIFKDVSGARAVEASDTWAGFCARLANLPPTATKEAAPLVKLAKFGQVRTPKGSLRHDDNVIAVTGIEGDYDAEAIHPDEALTRLERAGIRAAVVTTWSHKPERPRWRVFAPLSAPAAPNARRQLVARLNGALGGCLARESFALSQSFFVGGARGGEYRVLTTFDDPHDGEYIDLLDALDEIAQAPAADSGTGGDGHRERSADSELLAELLAGDSVHANALRIVARMVAAGVGDDVIKATFAVLADQVSAARGEDRGDRLRGAELVEMIAGARRKGFAPEDPEAAFERLQAMIHNGAAGDVDRIIVAIAGAGLTKAREELLLQEIKARFGLSLRVLRSDLLAAKSDNDSADYDHLEWARKVIAHMGEGDVLFSLGDFWRWSQSGVWGRIDDREVRQAAHAVIGERGVTKSLVDGVTDVCRTELYQADAPFDLCDWRVVNVANGTLELAGEGWHIRPHQRDDFLTTQLPVQYDPAADCPRFARFLQEIFDGDADAREKARCVLEAIGYTLLTTCRFEKFFLLIGSGANGKSVLLGVVEALVGSRYVAAVQPSQFENRFQRAHLHGKLANLVTEIAEGAEVADAQLKAIVSGELTTAEHKMRPPFDFRPFATCWFGTNHLPHTRDFSDALFRRAIVLTFNRKFYGADRDPHLKDKLLAELPGILAVSLRAIAGVIARGEFTIPPSSLAAAREWRLEADQVAQFVEDACVVAAGAKSTSAELYRSYQTWADAAGIRKTLGRKNFTGRLERLGMELGRGTGGIRIIHGVSPKVQEAYA